MANRNVVLENRTASPIMVNSQTVPAKSVAQLTLSDTTTDLHNFLDAGCIAGSHTTPGKAHCPICGYEHRIGEIETPSYLPAQGF